MRVLPRFSKPTLKPLRKGWRQLKRSLSVVRAVFVVELVLFALLCFVVFSGARRAWLDSLGQRSDLLATLILAAAGIAVHWAVRKYLLPRIKRYFSPVAYEERQVLFSLGQEARTASSIRELYAAIAKRIAVSFEADNVSILIRDETSGDYSLAASSETALGDLIEAARANHDKDLSEFSLGRHAFTVKRLLNLSTPLVIESDEFKIWERAMDNASFDARFTRTQEREVLKKLRTHLLVQVRTKDQMMGILSLGLRRGHFRYSLADREVLTSIAGQLALVIENAQLAERMVVQERLNRELALAVEVQQRLLPRQLPDSSALELTGFCEPARGVGGDYYDFITHEDRRLGIAIADVSGKGLPAALLMSTVQATLRSLAARNGDAGKGSGGLAETVSTLNRLLCDSTGGANYVTFFYAQFDPRTKALAYVNAGHNPPLYIRADAVDVFDSLSCGGMIVGIFKDCIYEQAVVETRPGDVLFAYTDGLTEAMNREGEEFGETRLREALTATAGSSVHEIRDELLRQIKQWSLGTPQYDDLTFVIMKVPLDKALVTT